MNRVCFARPLISTTSHRKSLESPGCDAGRIGGAHEKPVAESVQRKHHHGSGKDQLSDSRGRVLMCFQNAIDETTATAIAPISQITYPLVTAIKTAATKMENIIARSVFVTSLPPGETIDWLRARCKPVTTVARIVPPEKPSMRRREGRRRGRITPQIRPSVSRRACGRGVWRRIGSGRCD
jgi:hypothetical protein